VERAHLLDDIMDNLELESEYYKKAKITFSLGHLHPLYLLLASKEKT